MKRNLTFGILLIFAFTLIFTISYAKNSKLAWLGVMTQTVNDDLAEAFDLQVTFGAIINQVIEDSPADKAGLSEGDIIIAFNSQKVYDYDDLMDYIEDSHPDETLTLKIQKEDITIEIDVTLGKATNRLHKYRWNNKLFHSGTIPLVPSVPSMPNPPHINKHLTYENSAYIGVHLMDINEQLRENFGVRNDNGVMVIEVAEDSPAEKVGIKAGDIIIEADNNDITDYNDLKNLIAEKEDGEVISITLIRNKKKQQFDVTVAEHENQNYQSYNFPDISFPIPHNNNMTFFSDDLHNFFNSDEFKEEIQELKRELEHFKLEFHDQFREQLDSKEFKMEMKKFKKDLKSELKKLKKELKKLDEKHKDSNFEWKD